MIFILKPSKFSTSKDSLKKFSLKFNAPINSLSPKDMLSKFKNCPVEDMAF